MTTCSIWPRSARTRPSRVPGWTRRSMSSPINRFSIGSSSASTRSSSSTRGSSTWRRLKARSCRVSPAARRAALWISVAARWSGSPAGSSSVCCWLYARITVSRLLKSWATPPARRPTDSRRWAWRSRVSLWISASSARRRSVTSRACVTMPWMSGSWSRLVPDHSITRQSPSRCRMRTSIGGLSPKARIWSNAARAAARSSGWTSASGSPPIVEWWARPSTRWTEGLS